MEIRIAVGAFCPQLTLPCIGSVAYPDPTSCKHYYFCSDRGEVRRISCEDSFIDSRVKIAQGAALCVPSSKSTCQDDNPERQCAAVANFLPQEYCEVETPNDRSWVYPDPVDCHDYYKYTPTASLPPQRQVIVVEHRTCSGSLIYSPDSRDCVTSDLRNHNKCGGKWIHDTQECNPINSRDKWNPGKDGNPTRTHRMTTISTKTSLNTTAIGVVPGPPRIPIVPVLIALASTLAILTICATFCFVMYQRRQKTRQQRHLSSIQINETRDTGEDAILPPAFAELNDYAAIEEVFRNTQERQRLGPLNGSCVGPELPARNYTPDSCQPATASASRPRPLSQAAYPVPLVRRSKPHNVADRPAVAPKARESFGLFQNTDSAEEQVKPQKCIDMTWLQALNSSNPVDSESSDEYEAVEAPPDFQSNNNFDSLTLTELYDSDTGEYMVPIVGPDKHYSTVKKKKINNSSNDMPIIPKKISTVQIDPISDETDSYDRTASNRTSDSDEFIAFTPSDYSLEKAELHGSMHGTLSGKWSPRESWEVSGSWARVRSPGSVSKRLSNMFSTSKSCDSTTPELPPVVSSQDIETILEKEIDLDNTLKRKPLMTSSLSDTNGVVPLDHMTIPDANVVNGDVYPDFTLPVRRGSNGSSQEGSSNLTTGNPVVDVSFKMVSSGDHHADDVTSPGPRGRLGYEIVLSTDCPADFRLYQSISVESADSTEYTPNDATTETVSQDSKAKNHEYYILDKHHNSDDAFESTRNSGVASLGKAELNYRKSCRF